MYIFSCVIILWINDIARYWYFEYSMCWWYVWTLHLVLCVNASLGHLQYTCGHEGYEEKPFNILRFTYLNLKKDCKSLMGFIFFRSRLVYTSITSYGYMMCRTQFTLSNKYYITSTYRVLIMKMQATGWRMKQSAYIRGATKHK